MLVIAGGWKRKISRVLANGFVSPHHHRARPVGVGVFVSYSGKFFAHFGARYGRQSAAEIGRSMRLKWSRVCKLAGGLWGVFSSTYAVVDL